jgi:hypothetical protein
MEVNLRQIKDAAGSWRNTGSRGPWIAGRPAGFDLEGREAHRDGV